MHTCGEMKFFFFCDVEAEVAYQKIKKIIQTSTEIVELIKALIFTEDIERPSIIIGHTKETVRFAATLRQN